MLEKWEKDLISRNPKTRRSVTENIRFQLDQLGAQNAHHDFEHLCRQYARERIARNILPATGPVSAGGDQGKDFETFTSFVGQHGSRDTRFFFGAAETKTLVFACSLTTRTKIRVKVKADVTTICEASTPYLIYFFSSQSIPVSWRHELQAWSLEQKQCRLELIDAEALSEQLAEPGLFWIAEEYLHISAELYPTVGTEADSEYERARRRWIEGKYVPTSFADFVEVKFGVRRATSRDDLKPDLSRWIAKMEEFLVHDGRTELQRRASYEICVAALRGQHNLTPRRTLLEKYFGTWAQGDGQAELRDAAILLSYASSAVLHGEFQIETARLHDWSKALALTVNTALSNAPGPSARADLSFTRSTIASLPFLSGIKAKYSKAEIFKWWSKTVAAAVRAPLFPIESFADLLTQLVGFHGDDPQYCAIVERVDALLESRSKGYLVAEKSRDRAVALMDAGKTIAAIKELHKAKVKWFTGDTLEGTLLAMRSLSHAYLELGLIWAAKYHALSAAFVIAKSDDDDIRNRFAEALHQICICQYVGGEWASFSELFPIYFASHYEHVNDPDDWAKHTEMQGTVFHFLVMRSISKALGGQAAFDLVEQPFRALKMPEEIRDEVLSPPLPLEFYENMELKEVIKKTSAELWGRPFADCGLKRTYTWRALGITWSASCTNALSVLPYAEEFVAVLQIAIVDLAHVDLCLLPTAVTINVTLAEIDTISAANVPDNAKIAFEVRLPGGRHRRHDGTQPPQYEVLAVATMMLAACSCLPDEKFDKALYDALKQGLSSKTFLVRPYSELFTEFAATDGFETRRTTQIGGPEMSSFEFRQASELGWIDTPGPGYSKKKSEHFIANRYRRGRLPIRTTLERLRSSERFQEWVTRMRAEGMHDWQILLFILNSVLNFKAQSLGLDRDPRRFEEFSRAFLDSEEAVDAPVFPERILIDDQGGVMRMTTLATNARVWGLKIRRQTPDFKALERLLNVRYGQAIDDILHEDFLSANSRGI